MITKMIHGDLYQSYELVLYYRPFVRVRDGQVSVVVGVVIIDVAE